MCAECACFFSALLVLPQAWARPGCCCGVGVTLLDVSSFAGNQTMTSDAAVACRVSIVRELHVYGTAVAVHARDTGKSAPAQCIAPATCLCSSC
jgi:hypothetical protein